MDTGGPASERPKRGRPRSEKARGAILAAAAEVLLARGVEGASMDAVAERAGVSKATIYRWWPSKEMLALDALLEWADASAPARDTGALRDDLLTLVRPWMREIRTGPYGRISAALISAAQSDPVFADAYRTHFIQPRRETMRAALLRARERGEVVPDIDVELAVDLIYGTVYHRLLHGHAPLSDGFAAAVIDVVLDGIMLRATVGDDPT